MNRIAWKIICLLVSAFAMILLLAGCERQKGPDQAPPAASQAESSAVPSIPPTPSGDVPTAETFANTQSATLYVGTKAGGFTEYPLIYEGELTPEMLIQGIADLTGWDLTLAEAVTDGKGGMSVCLADTSSLFVGPPDPQKDEFHMYGAEQLAETILDSIQKTLQEGFTGERGNPDMLDIWYYMEGEKPLELPNIGRSWPIDQPYQWAVG